MADERDDRERLQQVQTSDTTESKVNEEFLDWLKSSGMNYLLVVLVVIAGFVGFQRYRQMQTAKRNTAWAEFFAAQLPESLEDVAVAYDGTDQIGNVARIEAAGRHLSIGMLGENPNAAPEIDAEGNPTTPEPLSDEERDLALSNADRLYGEVVDRVAAVSDAKKREDLALFAYVGHCGRAAVAEARGELDAARGHYEDAAALIETTYPALAARARGRAADVNEYAEAVVIPSQETVAAVGATPPRPTPVNVLPALAPLLPDADEGDGDDAPTP